MIPLVRRIVLNIRARHRLLAKKQEQVMLLGIRPDGETEAAAAARDGARERTLRANRRLRDEIKTFSAELESLGCFLRDADGGVVECYGELRGDIVYFTWQPGSKVFQAWHPLDQSFVNRQPMPGIESKAAL